jgi:hypothetical protein
LIDDSRSEIAPSEAPSTVFEINPPRWVSKMFGVGPGSSTHPRDSENSQSIQSERNGVEEAAAAAAREVARELGAGGGCGRGWGGCQPGELEPWRVGVQRRGLFRRRGVRRLRRRTRRTRG